MFDSLFLILFEGLVENQYIELIFIFAIDGKYQNFSQLNYSQCQHWPFQKKQKTIQI